MNKQTFFGFRINQEEKDAWFAYAFTHGYESLAAFIRDSINGLISNKKKPSKLVIIENAVGDKP